MINFPIDRSLSIDTFLVVCSRQKVSFPEDRNYNRKRSKKKDKNRVTQISLWTSHSVAAYQEKWSFSCFLLEKEKCNHKIFKIVQEISVGFYMALQFHSYVLRLWSFPFSVLVVMSFVLLLPAFFSL